MNKMFLLGAVASVVVFTTGCGEPASEPGGSSFGMQPIASSQGGEPSDPVARTVHDFLAAIRAGDTQSSSSRLTPLALQMINENDMTFAHPASENAMFEVGQVEMYGPDKASVDSVWSDLDADGVPVRSAGAQRQPDLERQVPEGQERLDGLAAHGQ